MCKNVDNLHIAGIRPVFRTSAASEGTTQYALKLFF